MRLPFDSLIFYNRLVSVNVGYPFHPFTAKPSPLHRGVASFTLSPQRLKHHLRLVLALNNDEYAVLVGWQLIAYKATHDVVNFN